MAAAFGQSLVSIEVGVERFGAFGEHFGTWRLVLVKVGATGDRFAKLERFAAFCSVWRAFCGVAAGMG